MRTLLSPSFPRRRGPIPSVPMMRKVLAMRGNSGPTDNHRWLWVPAFAGTTVSFRIPQAVIQRKNP
jgi:hypothetical protein